jgi:polyhydroxyalkanoate synthesis regulator phasin
MNAVMLSRDRIQEVADDAVRRGRMTRADAEDLVARLLDRGRKQTDDVLAELDSVLRRTRVRR